MTIVDNRKRIAPLLAYACRKGKRVRKLPNSDVQWPVTPKPKTSDIGRLPNSGFARTVIVNVRFITKNTRPGTFLANDSAISTIFVLRFKNEARHTVWAPTLGTFNSFQAFSNFLILRLRPRKIDYMLIVPARFLFSARLLFLIIWYLIFFFFFFFFFNIRYNRPYAYDVTEGRPRGVGGQTRHATCTIAKHALRGQTPACLTAELARVRTLTERVSANALCQQNKHVRAARQVLTPSMASLLWRRDVNA